MKPEDVMEVIECLPKGKTHFQYFKNSYAPRLLSMALPGSTPVQAVRKSHFGKFLENPLVKQTLAKSGNGMVDPATLRMVWQEPSRSYLLTATRRRYASRGWSQVSRAGDNLVLQLNLPKTHQRLFEQHVGNATSFNAGWAHPIQRNRGQQTFRETLAWVRIDLSFDTNEALIEEVQSDAVFKMQHLAKRVARCHCSGCKRRARYLQWFAFHKINWSEAMLMAAIGFIAEELGITQLYMHTVRSGWQVKNMGKNWNPPKSLYSDLPRRFGFRQTWNAPVFLLETRSYQKLIRQQPDIDFHYIDLANVITVGKKNTRVGGCHA